jgi:putative transposase
MIKKERKVIHTMKNSRFTAEQVAFALWQAESGAPVVEIYRKKSITEHIFHCWNKKYL